MEHNERAVNRGVVPPLMFQLGTSLMLVAFLFKRDEVRGTRLFPLLHSYVGSMQAICSQLFGAQVLQDWSTLQLPDISAAEQRAADAQLQDLPMELDKAKIWLTDLICKMPAVESTTFELGLEAACHSLAPISESLQDRALLKLFWNLVAIRPLVDERRAQMSSTPVDGDDVASLTAGQ